MATASGTRNMKVYIHACIIVGSDAERQMEAWERERNAGRD